MTNLPTTSEHEIQLFSQISYATQNASISTSFFVSKKFLEKNRPLQDRFKGCTIFLEKLFCLWLK